MEMFKLLIIAIITIAYTRPLEVGDSVRFSIANQFNNIIDISNNTKYLYITYNKKTTDCILEYFQHRTIEQNTKIIADMSNAPKILISLLVKPIYRRFRTSVMILKDKNIAQTLPKTKEGTIVKFDLYNKKITKISYKKCDFKNMLIYP